MHDEKRYTVKLAKSGKGKKEIRNLLKRRNKQVKKAVKKLQNNPVNLKDKNIEKLNNPQLGEYSIRVSKGDRLYYDVDTNDKEVHILPTLLSHPANKRFSFLLKTW